MTWLLTLQGKWNFQRTILSSGASHEIVAQGEFIERGASVLRYQESGIFDIYDRRHKFFCEYEYQQHKDEIQVYFVENNKRVNLFHVLKFSDSDPEFMLANAEHFCGDDSYKILYRIFTNNKDKFEIRYDVKGPAKDYVSNTVFSRA